MSAIAAYRTAVLALLDDAALARYTNAQVDVALLWALGQYSKARPVMRTYSASGAGTYLIELPSDFAADKITDIYLDDGSDPPVSIAFTVKYVDESWYILTTERLLSASDDFVIIYDASQTIDGLASASGTTIPVADEWLIQIGAAGYAARMRAVSRAESINMQPEVRKQLQELAEAYLKDFNAGVKPVAGIQTITLPDPDDKF